MRLFSSKDIGDELIDFGLRESHSMLQKGLFSDDAGSKLQGK